MTSTLPAIRITLVNLLYVSVANIIASCSREVVVMFNRTLM